MLILDKSLTSVEVESQAILALYRSSSVVQLAGEGFGPQPWQAFICTTEQSDGFTIHVALLNTGSRKVQVYVPEEQPEEKSDYETALSSAVKFAEEMGFSMKEVNLDYSKALREVIITDTRVIRLVKTAKKHARKKSEARNSNVHGGGNTNSKTSAAVKSTDERIIEESLQPETSAPPEHEERIRDTAELELSTLKDIAAFTAEVEKALTLKSDAEEVAAQELANARAEVARLTAEIADAAKAAAEELASLLAEAERLSAEQQKLNSDNSARLAAAKAEVEKLKAKMRADENAAHKELKNLKAEAERIAAKNAKAAKATAEDLAAARAEIDRLVAEENASELAAAEQLAALRSEAQRIEAERPVVETGIAEEIETARAEVDRLIVGKNSTTEELMQKLSSLRQEAEQLAEEKRSAETEAEKAVTALREEIARLSSEKAAVEASAAQELVLLQEEIDKYAAEKDAAEKALAAQAIALRDRLQTVLGGTVAVPSVAEIPVYVYGDAEQNGPAAGTSPSFHSKTKMTGDAAATAFGESVADNSAAGWTAAISQPSSFTHVTEKASPKQSSMKFGEVGVSVEQALAELTATSVAATDSNAGLVDQEGSLGIRCGDGFSTEDGSPAEFNIDKSMTAIEYATAVDMVEVYQSLNITRITPEGYLAQNSKAYICVLAANELYSVYIGLFLTESGQVLIYSCNKQANSGNFRTILQDAIDFLETAGFLMDPLSLGLDKESREKIVANLPVTRRLS